MRFGRPDWGIRIRESAANRTTVPIVERVFDDSNACSVPFERVFELGNGLLRTGVL